MTICSILLLVIRQTEHFKFAPLNYCSFSQKNGVAQSGALSSTVFNIIIDQVFRDFPRGVNHCLYADDIVIWLSGADLYPTISRLQMAIDLIQQKRSQFGLEIPSAKTTATLFRKSSSKQPNPSTPLLLSGIPIKFLKFTKFLGVVLDPQLSFRHHIFLTKTRALKRLCILKCLLHPSYGTSCKVLIRLYCTLICPILEHF